MPLYAFGSNSSGQLGIGHVEDTCIPTRCLFESIERDARCEQPRGREDEQSSSSSGGGGGGGIVQIATGGNHTLLRCRNGEVYAAGFNGDGRIDGCCNPSPDTTDTSTTAGCAERQREEDLGVTLRFRRVVVVEGHRTWDRFALVSATWEGTFLVPTWTSPSLVFVLGSGSKGELGLGPNVHLCRCPVRIPDFPPLSLSSSSSSSLSPSSPPPAATIVAIASSMAHTVVVVGNGDVYGWGASRKGQLGSALRDKKIIWSPAKLDEVPFRATDVACGREFTVVCGDKQKGEFVIFGSPDNRWGLLSHVPLPLLSTPSPSPAPTLKSALVGPFQLPGGYCSILTSWNGVYVHRNDSSVVAWGRDDRGQLLPASLQGAPLKAIAVGSEHGLALLDDGTTVVAFGWGEHGNCGPETDQRGDVKGRYNAVSVPLQREKIIGIAGGCATSWIITS